MTVHDLPVVNASLNGLSAVFIVTGLVSIKADRKKAHIASMTAALVTSTIFLACYLTYHFSVRAITHFTYPGWPAKVYFPILITHVALAFVTLPLVVITVTPALRARYDRHRRMARWTWPIWLYVSVTGVIVYLMLYVWFPPAR
jgi:putative membrane protein